MTREEEIAKAVDILFDLDENEISNIEENCGTILFNYAGKKYCVTEPQLVEVLDES